MCLVEPKRVTALSRTGRDMLPYFPELDQLRGAFKKLPVVVDGEIVSLDARGHSSFQRLQPRINRLRGGDPTPGRVAFVVFDLLGRGDADLRARTLDERKAALEASLSGNDDFVMRSKSVIGTGKRLFEQAHKHGIEGIVAKRRASPYVSGRTRDWLKLKAVLSQEFVIVGWTEPRGSRRHLGALLLGVYDKGTLRFAGHVGTGFDGATLADLYRRLAPLETKRKPVPEDPLANAPIHWVRPKLVAEVKFAEWTYDGVLRHPAYLGLRIDKRPRECVRESVSTGSRR
jgi:bifunctional non-homologous end joining protein LigD